MKTKLFKRVTTGIAIFAMVGFIWGMGLQTEAVAKAPAPTDTKVQMVPLNFAELAKEVRSGVVNIRTVKNMKGGGPVYRHFFGNPFGGKEPFPGFGGPGPNNQPPREFKQRSLGSGFIINKEGFIVTNNHVVENADEITVRLFNEKEYDAEVVGRDPNTDLALIKIDGGKDLVPLKMGNSGDIEIGNWVVAVGSPFGLEQTVTAGIVSAKGRVIGAGPYDDFIQTDASINPGNSGGPLLNMNGEVVGINTAIIAQGQGIGFAIPVDMAKNIVAQLKDKGTVTRGWLGVGIQDLTPELAEYYGLENKEGVLVTQVFEGDPAEKAGIKPNDLITSVNGKKVKSSRDLSATIAGISVGDKTKVHLLRDGKSKSVTVEIAKRKDSEPLAKVETQDKKELGIQISELTPESARQFGYQENEKGVVVMGVKPGSKADQAGIQQGDLVKEINRNPVRSIDDLRAEVGKAKDDDSMQMLVKRPNAGFLVIKIS